MQRGFSTLEILIAMTILVMCFSATMLLLPGIQDATAQTERSDDSLAIAKRMLEEEQSKARKDFKLVVPWTSEETIDSITYLKEVAVTTLSYTSKKITAKVSHEGLFGRPEQTTELSTIVSNFEQVVGGDTCDSVLSGNWSSPQVTNRLLGANILGDSTGNYILSDLEAHTSRLYASVRGTSGNQGANFPDIGANTTLSGATISWASANTGNVISSNNLYATANMSGSQTTNYLYAHDFDFAIPQGATILGIQVDIERSRSSGSGNSNNIRDNAVKLVRADGTVGGTNRAPNGTNCAADWSTTDCVRHYGTTADLWGEEWIASDLNDTDFGVVLSAVGVPVTGGNNRTAQVDAVTVTVTYIPQFYRLKANTPTNPTLLGEIRTATAVAPVGAGYNALAVATSTSYGDYAFAATNSSAAQLQVIDLSQTNPKIIESYQVPGAGTAVGTAVFFKDGYLYLGLEASAGAEFQVIDVHNPADLPAPLGTYEIGSGINAIYVEDNRAYLATNDTSRELIILDISDLERPQLDEVYNASGASPGQGKSLYTIGDSLYLGRYYSSTGHEFMALDVAGTPTLTGSADVGTSISTMGVYGTIVRDTLAFLLTGNSTTNSNGRVQIYRTDTMTQSTSISLPNSGMPVALDCEGNTLYAASVPSTGGNTNKGSISIITAP
jgi:type II secretory pathway pseudopilin PulG